MGSNVDEDALYTMLDRVIKKRITYPTILMNKERDRLDAELQKFEQMKVELEDSEELSRTKIAAKDTKKLVSQLETPIDFEIFEQLKLRKEENLVEIGRFMAMREEWANRQ